ncbi:hypothetical protein CO731_00336 [Aminobacter sp. MSH1]|nr:hypothetical protein CO731_00336 [Aminobacter sp. MSH1]
MQVDVIDRLEELERLRTDWEATYSADPEAHFFLTWTWISNWLRGLRHPWVVLAVRSGSGGYVAFLPLRYEPISTRKQVSIITFGWLGRISRSTQGSCAELNTNMMPSLLLPGRSSR